MGTCDHSREVNSGGDTGSRRPTPIYFSLESLLSSVALMGIQLTLLICIIKLWSSCKRRPFGALNSHLINQRSIKTHEHLLTLGFLASFEMLNVTLSSVCKLGLAASISLRPPYTLAVMHSPLGVQMDKGWGWGGCWGGQSFISVQLTSVRLSDSGDG